jgi:chemotaxis family two-component system response regulator Rcp1
MSNIIEILLVEDSLSDRFLALEALSEAKIPNNVHAVPDGVEALDFVRRTGKYVQAPRPDLILLDLNLPRKDGRVVLAELKAEPDLRKIPVVILATSGDADVGLRSYPEHAQSFITKPIDVGQFDEIMRIYKFIWFPDLEDAPPTSAKTNSSAADQSKTNPMPLEQEGGTSANLSALSSMLAITPDEGLLLTDPQSNTLWVNEAFSRMSGYSLQEILGRKAESLFRGPNTDQAAEERMRKAVAGGRNCREEIVNYHKDGHPYSVRLMMNPLYGPDGVVRGFLAVEQLVQHK